MKADVTLQALYFNKGIAKFFFREQAYNTLEQLVRLFGYDSEAFDELEARVEEVYQDLDLFEEDCYDLSAEDVAEVLGY